MRQLFTESAAPSFEFIDIDGTPIEIKTASVDVSAGATNTQIVAAVTGKRLRILSLVAHWTTGSSYLRFKSASGGTRLLDLNVSTDHPDVFLPPNKLGWMDTLAGQGLFADGGAGGTIVVSVRYVEFTQAT